MKNCKKIGISEPRSEKGVPRNSGTRFIFCSIYVPEILGTPFSELTLNPENQFDSY